jgi:outer membrane protein assembly factor BamB
MSALLPLEQAWSVPLASPPAAGAALDDDHVYVPLEGEQMVALDRETGQRRWTIPVESAWPPLVVGPLLYLAASDELHAFDRRTGERRWRTPLERGLTTRLRVNGGLLLASTPPDRLVALRADTGEPVWARALGGDSGAIGLAAGEGSVVVTLADGRVVCLHLKDGTVRWERSLPGALTEPSVGRGRVFVGSSDKRLYALHSATGAPQWIARAGGGVIGTAVDGDVVYVAALDNLLRALNRGNGNQRWKRALTTRPTGPLWVADGVVLVTGTDPALSTFSAESGQPLPTYTPPAEPVGAILVDPVLKAFRVAVVVVTGDGKVLGLRPASMMLREPALVPLTAPPGRALDRERLGAPK